MPTVWGGARQGPMKREGGGHPTPQPHWRGGGPGRPCPALEVGEAAGGGEHHLPGADHHHRRLLLPRQPVRLRPGVAALRGRGGGGGGGRQSRPCTRFLFRGMACTVELAPVRNIACAPALAPHFGLSFGLYPSMSPFFCQRSKWCMAEQRSKKPNLLLPFFARKVIKNLFFS